MRYLHDQFYDTKYTGSTKLLIGSYGKKTNIRNGLKAKLVLKEIPSQEKASGSLGKIHIGGISLGVTFVFFTGILAGHFGLSIDDKMLAYAESFGLVIFIYSLGLQVGPGFFNSFRKEGITFNMLSTH